MNKREMVKAILDKGALISPDLLDRLNEDILNTIINNGSARGKDFVLDALPKTPTKTAKNTDRPAGKSPQEPDPEAVKEQTKITKPEPPPDPSKEPDVVALKRADPRPEGISLDLRRSDKAETLVPNDFVKYFNNKYETLKGLLLKKINAVSINKLNSHSTLTVIGMVKEMTRRGFIIEDPTGQTEAVVSQDNIRNMAIAEDDVLAITGNAMEGVIFVKAITLPDVPLTNPVGSIDATMLLSETSETGNQDANPGKAYPDADIVSTPGSITANINKSNHSNQPEPQKLANPAWIDMKKAGKAIKLLIFKPNKDSTLNDAVSLLRKRHLSPGRNAVRGTDDPFLIENVPDIFWFVSKEKGFKAYKGVTIISCGPNSAALVDLGTRKVEFI